MVECDEEAKAQISLSRMLRKYLDIMPISGSKNQERIIENLGAWNVTLTEEEFAALAHIPVQKTKPMMT